MTTKEIIAVLQEATCRCRKCRGTVDPTQMCKYCARVQKAIDTLEREEG